MPRRYINCYFHVFVFQDIKRILRDALLPETATNQPFVFYYGCAGVLCFPSNEEKDER